MKAMKILLLIIVVFLILYFGGNILYATLTDFKPAPKQKLEVKNPISLTIQDSTLTFFIWNIGYGGLGEKEDFFFDGGKMVRPPKERVMENLKGIYDVVGRHKDADFILLQEVDTNSKRSYCVNEAQNISETLGDHNFSFAINYKVNHIPMPLNVPPWKVMGKVRSGLATYAKYQPLESIRYAFPGNYSWPKKVFFLDRCFLLQRFALPGSKQLVVINTHNSAYDDGTLKSRQMRFLKDLLLEEYNKGNYVLVGGDWNQCPPGFDYQSFGKDEGGTYVQRNVPKDFLPEWRWVYDKTVATNRKLATPFEKGKTFTTLIDFYLVSPNVDVKAVQGVETDFKYSDHQPVLLTVELAYKNERP